MDSRWRPESISPTRELGPGTKPAIAVDARRRAVHLVYRDGERLFYRLGDLDGSFRPAEQVLDLSPAQAVPAEELGPAQDVILWDPRIALDKNGDPHVVVSNGHYLNRYVWYTNRIGGSWKPKLTVLDKKAHVVNRATMASIAIDDDLTVFISALAPAGLQKGQSYGINGMLARLTNVADKPVVKLLKRDPLEAPQLVLARGELWIGGAMNKNYFLWKLDKRTLAPVGAPVQLITSGRRGEIARVSVDAHGDIHVASSYVSLLSGPRGGWYSSLFRARTGKGPIHYRTTNRHAWGAGMPVRDPGAGDRVYVLHWSGAEGDQAGEIPFAKYRQVTNNQLRFARIEQGMLIKEEQPITDRRTNHGYSRRATPAAAAHPDGGVIVVFQEFGEKSTTEADEVGTLFFTRIGVK